MDLSASEKRFIARWRKHERTWPFVRWLILLITISSWLASGYVLLQLGTSGERVGVPPGFAAFEVDVFYFMNLGSVALATLTLIRWRGDARITLLLKLVEMHENDCTQPTAAPTSRATSPPGNSAVTKGPLLLG